MRAAVLSYSISRAYGGIFEISRRTAQTLVQQQHADVSVLGVEDEFTIRDLPLWQPLQPRTFRSRGPRAFGFAPALLRALEEAQVDLVHVHGLWTFPTSAARKWSRTRFRPYLISIHGMLDQWALKNAHWKKTIAGALFEKAALRDATCLHVNTMAELESVRRYGLKNPVCVIPNGVDLPAKTRLSARWAGEVPDDSRIILYLGRLHPKKGLSNLLAAWAALQKSGTAIPGKWHLVIAGWDQNGHATELKRLTVESGVEQSVSFAGPLFGEAKEAAFRNSQAFVLPSFSEGLPMAVLEAWAHGLPVVMTPQCNLSEGFSRRAALSVEPNADNISTGLNELRHLSDAERARMGEAGRSLVAEHFTWPAVAAQFADVYQWMVGSQNRPEFVFVE